MRVIEIIEQIKNSNDNFFVLIDTAKNHLYFRCWLKNLAKDQFIQLSSLFEGTIDESSPLEVSPLLLQLNEDNSQMVNERLFVDENIGMFSIIQTGLSGQGLIRHLQPYLQAQMPTGELALFRFYDPSIIKILHKMLNSENYKQLLSPIDCWWYQNLEGCFSKVREI